jgi:hypothetical protein
MIVVGRICRLLVVGWLNETVILSFSKFPVSLFKLQTSFSNFSNKNELTSAQRLGAVRMPKFQKYFENDVTLPIFVHHDLIA